MSEYLIAIPGYNCEKQIVRVIAEIARLQLIRHLDILVIDNCSEDETRRRAQEALHLHFGEISSNTVIRNPQNLGLGGSFKVAANWAREKGYRGFFFIHGDDQADPKDLARMFHVVKQSPEPIVLWGSRFSSQSVLENYSRIRQIGNRLLNLIFSMMLLRPIHDIGSGLNYFDCQYLNSNLLEKLPTHIAYDVPLLGYLIEQQNFVFFPISWRSKDEVSTVGNLKVGFLALQGLARFLKTR